MSRLRRRERDSDNTESDSTRKARKLTERLLYDIEDHYRSYTSESSEIFVADVESDVDRFGSQLRFCIEDGLSFPCLRLRGGDPLPLDWTFGADIPSSDRDSAHRILHCSFDHLDRRAIEGLFADESGFELIYNEPEEVKGFFGHRLIQFLTSRFKSSKSTQATLGLTFKVVTSSTGLRIHYSHAYQLSPKRVFGSPTSPVTGYIQPGRYIFGVAGAGLSSPKFSDAEFDIPPSTQADLLEL